MLKLFYKIFISKMNSNFKSKKYYLDFNLIFLFISRKLTNNSISNGEYVNEWMSLL